MKPGADPTQRSFAELAAAIRARELSSVEVVRAHIERIERDTHHAVVTLCAEQALAQAQAADREVARGTELGPAHGVPFAVKDAIATAGVRSTAGSRLLVDNVPEEDAPAVRSLRAAGAILLAKTNCAELALGPRTDNWLFGRTINPHDHHRSPGGSSGGCAAAVAAGCVPLSLGSDYGGSVRFPAHCCGVFGLRPTIGRVAAEGQVPAPVADSPRARFSVIGPIARTAEDLRLALEIISARSSAGERPAPRVRRCAVTTSGAGVPIPEDLTRAVEHAASTLATLGVRVTRATPPEWTTTEWLFTAIRATDEFADVRTLARGRESLLGELITERLAEAPLQAPAERARMLTRAGLLRRETLRFFGEHHILLAPIAATAALRHDQRELDLDGSWPVIDQMRFLAPCRAVSLLGLPAAAVPAGRTHDGLPVGVQVVGAPNCEDEVLAVARVLEHALGGWIPPPAKRP